MAWHPNCNYVATGSADTTVRLWHVASGDCVRILVGHRSAVCSVATSPCGNQLASGSIDGTICLWDLNEGKRIAQLKGHKGPVWSLCYSHGLQNSPLLASGGADCTLRLWGAAQASYGNLQHANDVMQNGGNFGAYDLLRSCQTKSTPIFSLNFTRTNLLSASGALTLQSRKM